MVSYLVTVSITLFSRNSYSERTNLKVTQLNSSSIGLGAQALSAGMHSLLEHPLRVRRVSELYLAMA